MPPLWAAGLAALVALAGWQALVLALLIGAWALVRVVKHSGRRATSVAFAAGAGRGLLLLAWLLSAFGGTLGPLVGQFGARTGQTPRTELVQVGMLFTSQRHYGAGMFGVVGLLGLGLVIACGDARTRASPPSPSP